MIDRYRRIRREIQQEQAQGEEGGFTLIELLIVIVVIGILAAVTVFGLSNVTGQSLTSACHADAKSVAVAAEAYHAQNSNQWPTMAQLLGTGPTDRYLRTPPGNTTKYVITLGPAGQVNVQNLVTPANTGDAENFTTTDPCSGL